MHGAAGLRFVCVRRRPRVGLFAPFLADPFFRRKSRHETTREFNDAERTEAECCARVADAAAGEFGFPNSVMR